MYQKRTEEWLREEAWLGNQDFVEKGWKRCIVSIAESDDTSPIRYEELKNLSQRHRATKNRDNHKTNADEETDSSEDCKSKGSNQQ